MKNYIKTNYPDGLNENMAVGFLRQLMNGFMEIHKYGIMNRNLKPENIFLKNNNLLVIGDFGFAKYSEEYKQTTPGMSVMINQRDNIEYGTSIVIRQNQQKKSYVQFKS